VLERPNDFALPYADFVTDVPGDFSRYDVLDETVPFLQMVYSGLTGYAKSLGRSSTSEYSSASIASTASAACWVCPGYARFLL